MSQSSSSLVPFPVAVAGHAIPLRIHFSSFIGKLFHSLVLHPPYLGVVYYYWNVTSSGAPSPTTTTITGPHLPNRHFHHRPRVRYTIDGLMAGVVAGGEGDGYKATPPSTLSPSVNFPPPPPSLHSLLVSLPHHQWRSFLRATSHCSKYVTAPLEG